MIEPNYVVGFLYDPSGHVLLIEKNRPKWQAGKLNGVGGKIEGGEWPIEAMVREFEEETGLASKQEDWTEFFELRTNGVTIYFYHARTPLQGRWFHDAQDLTDEPCVVRSVDSLHETLIIPNLHWLIPMGWYAEMYQEIHSVGVEGECRAYPTS